MLDFEEIIKKEVKSTIDEKIYNVLVDKVKIRESIAGVFEFLDTAEKRELFWSSISKENPETGKEVMDIFGNIICEEEN